MALIYYTGFEGGLNYDWQLAGGTYSQSATAKSGSYSLLVNPSGSNVGHVSVFPPDSTGDYGGFAKSKVAWSFWFRVTTAPAVNDEPMFLAQATAAGNVFEMRLNSSRQLVVYNSALTLVATGSTVLSLNTWYRITGYVNKGASGAYAVEINGASELSGTSNFGTADIVTVILGKRYDRNGAGVSFRYDDLIIDDANIPDDLLITYAKPIANGSTMQWSSGSGASNYTQVDEIPASTSDYVMNPASTNQVALFSFESAATAGINNGKIRAVLGAVGLEKNVSGDTVSFKVRTRSNGTNYDLTADNLFGVDTHGVLYATDPNGGGAWTKTRFNALEFGGIETTAKQVKMYWASLAVLHERDNAGTSALGGDAAVTATGLIINVGSSNLVGDAAIVAEGYLSEQFSTADIVGDAEVLAYATSIQPGESALVGSAIVTARGINITEIIEVDKHYVYKVYDLDGNFVGQWNDVVSEFTYSQEINSAGSAIDIVLARNSDTKEPALGELLTDGDLPILTSSDLPINTTEQTTDSVGPGSNVVLNYNVDVYIFYGSFGELATEDSDTLTTEAGDLLQVQQGTPDGSIIFQGYISKYISKYGGDEKTTVTLTSYGSELDNYLIEEGGFTELAYLSDDPSAIVKDIIDLYKAQGGIVDYTSTSVENTDSVVSYTFNTATTLEGIKKCLELAPADWFWYLDMKNNIVHFHSRPTTPRHTFILGKHIMELNVEQYIDDIANVVYFSGGETSPGVNLYKKYTDPTSEGLYRRGLVRYSDNRVILEESADIIASNELSRNSTPRYRSSVVIVDRVYEIESIKLGDLVGFRNFDNYVDDLQLQVVAIDYSADAVRLQLDTLLPRVTKRLEDIKRNLDKQETLANPDTPAT